ncbi:hypothetical protein G4G28_02280 [Massilia sp. Dwa41.01b]|uniref:hypothetical protein n=1 Tax=unclassified Massilia TaxID=2609279 RepID=UPI00160277D8|nr:MULTISPECIES: hypothetical protein [unclassified Massilia]QNA87586.1 hypothetical protein G4G28_02280 [Massilia sp. Dwa41.01b]QNA98489.1 hypothetical protein G4G31_06025 [Massilia sp. Se16.2.3]
MTAWRRALLLVMAGFLSSCSLFDSGVEWRGGPYALLWIDTPENVSLARDEGEGSWDVLVDSTVFAVGWDGRYLVAKQHPEGNRGTTSYFIVDTATRSPQGAVRETVTGPLTAPAFEQKAMAMALPAFSTVLDHLQ